jgi:hypothetical protein
VKLAEVQLYTVKGNVNGRHTYTIHVVATNVNKAWQIAKAWPPDSPSIRKSVDWQMPRRVLSRAVHQGVGRVIVGEVSEDE